MITLGLDLDEWGDGITKARNQFKVLEKGVTSGLKKVGVGAVMVAGAITGMFGMGELMADQTRPFEILQNKVGATDAEMVTLRDDVYELNKALGLRSVTDAANKFSLVAKMSRATGDELERLTYQTGLLEKMFGNEEEQLGAQIALMKAYKTSAGEAGDIVAFLNNQGGDIKGELLESIKEYSVQFAEAGFSLNQTVAVLKEGLAKGWNVDKAADAFKEARIRLMGGEKATIDALEILGLNDLDNQLKSGSLSVFDAMGQIQDELSKLNQTEQFRIAKEIFGTPYEDVGGQAMKAMLEGMRKEVSYTGAIDQLSESLNNRFSHKWDQGMSNLGNSFSSMIETLKPHVLPLVEGFTELTDDISTFSRKYEYITKTIGLSIGAFTGLIAVLGGIAVVAGIAGIAMAVLTSPIALVALAVLGVGAGINYLESEFGFFTNAWSGIVNDFNKDVERFKAIGDDIKIKWNEFTAFITDTVPFDEFIKEVGEVFDKIERMVKTFRNSWIGQKIGISEDEPGVSAKNIKEGKPYVAPTNFDTSGFFRMVNPTKESEETQKGATPYQIYIRNYHSNSRNAAADWGTLVETGG
ncbi:phage tail tape measure protein [bacterium]|nr:phage tail tape measure protein [bacterium]